MKRTLIYTSGRAQKGNDLFLVQCLISNQFNDWNCMRLSSCFDIFDGIFFLYFETKNVWSALVFQIDHHVLWMNLSCNLHHFCVLFSPSLFYVIWIKKNELTLNVNECTHNFLKFHNLEFGSLISNLWMRARFLVYYFLFCIVRVHK